MLTCPMGIRSAQKMDNVYVSENAASRTCTRNIRGTLDGDGSVAV